jgi:hypothetical protein
MLLYGPQLVHDKAGQVAECGVRGCTELRGHKLHVLGWVWLSPADNMLLILCSQCLLRSWGLPMHPTGWALKRKQTQHQRRQQQ